MASPHGSASPAATLGSQPQYGYPQHQQNTAYDSGLMPATEQYGKEVVAPHVQQEQQQEQAQGYAPLYQQQTPQGGLPTPASSENRVCGVRRTTFFLALLAAVLLAGVIGAAAAAGIVASNKGSNNAAPVSSSTSTPEDAASSVAPSVTSSSASTTATFTAVPLPEEPEGLGITRPLCPGSNETYSTVPGTDLRFYHECGINYPFNDIGNIPMTSMADCLIQCAAQNIRPQSAAGPCRGVSWVYGKRQGVDGEACFLKFAKGGAAYDETKIESAFLVDT